MADGRGAHASPEVSNIAASSASRALLPAQTTNWNAGEIALAGVERGAEQRLALLAGGFDAAGQHQRVAEHHDAFVGPEIEMADPQLLVDQRDQSLNFGAPALRHLEIEGAGQMQRLDVVHPGVGHLVVGPFAR